MLYLENALGHVFDVNESIVYMKSGVLTRNTLTQVYCSVDENVVIRGSQDPVFPGSHGSVFSNAVFMETL